MNSNRALASILLTALALVAALAFLYQVLYQEISSALTIATGFAAFLLMLLSHWLRRPRGGDDDTADGE